MVRYGECDSCAPYMCMWYEYMHAFIYLNVRVCAWVSAAMSESIAQKRAEMSARIDAQREARKNERDLKKAVDLAETADETIRFPHLAQFVESFNAQKRGACCFW